MVSIIMPNYNGDANLEKSIRSVLNQSFTNFELIIIDDNSTDNSLKVINHFLNSDKRIKLLVNEENIGPSLSRNKGVNFSRGKYIAFLDSDDLWEKSKLEIQVNFMESNEIKFSYTSYVKFDHNDLIRTVHARLKINEKMLLRKNYLGTSSVMINKEFFGEMIEFKDLKRAEDYELWLRLIKESKMIYGIKDTLMKYRVGNESLSSKKIEGIIYRYKLFRKTIGMSKMRSLYYVAMNILLTFQKEYSKHD